MQDLQGKTAVITGGASGMGKAFAAKFGASGMNVVIGDIEEPALEATVAELRDAGVEITGVRTDVSDPQSVDELAEAARAAYGGFDLVALNAGVGGGTGRLETLSLKDWQWTINVNMWGVIHGIMTFLPELKAKDSGHVLITASVAGHLSYPSMGPYNATKFAAVTLAETLKAELTEDGSNVGVTCLCPGLVMTGIFQSERNRPETLIESGPAEEPQSAENQARREAMIEMIVANSKSADMVAELVHDAVTENTFWVFTDGDFDAAMAERHRAIQQRRTYATGESLLSIYDQ